VAISARRGFHEAQMAGYYWIEYCVPAETATLMQ
jgi:hypothetical protein